MKIVSSHAVFWSPAGADIQFHADVNASSAADAVALFREMFPRDAIRSVRGRDGRFASFN